MEEYKVRQIPDNYENGIQLLGFSFRTAFILEGLALFVIFGGGLFLILNSLNSYIGVSVGFSLAFGGIFLLLGIHGICDEPITTFLKHFRSYKKNRRVAYYNPRVKEEAKSITTEREELTEKTNEVKDKLLGGFNKVKLNNEIKNRESVKEYELNNSFDKENMYFEDDLNFIEKPNSYRTEKEYKEYDKKKKKMLDFQKTIKEEE